MPTTTHLYDVLIVGGGPVGLSLACELGMRGTSVAVLERDLYAESPWKTAPFGRRGINTPSVENLYRRGFLEKLFDMDERATKIVKTQGFQFGGHFAGIALDINKLDLSKYKYRLDGPGLSPGALTIDQLVKAFLERLKTLGVPILSGHNFQEIVVETRDSIKIKAGDRVFESKWLVGCDGGRSIVRKKAGFDFVGTEPQLTGYSFAADLDPPDILTPGFHNTGNGMYIVGPGNIFVFDFDDGRFDRTQEITEHHLEEVIHRVTGKTEIKVKKIHLATTYTDRSMQARSYRRGRIILAGDAAHIHSPLGAQGLNLGLGDAMNLGWKLATTVNHSLDMTLLDTYEKERHSIAAWVLEWTRAQISTLRPNKFGVAVQNLIKDLIATVDGNNLFIDRVWGLSQRYQLYEGQHDLIGRSVPDFEFLDGSRLGPKLINGKGVFLDFTGDEQTVRTIPEHRESIDCIQLPVKNRLGLDALLVRPDGVVVWLSEAGLTGDELKLETALQDWFPQM